MIENWPILSILIFLPLCGALLVLLIPHKTDQDGEISKNSITNVKLVSLWTSLMTFFLTLFLTFKFDYSKTDYQFLEYSEWVPSLGIVYRVGLDGLSLPFVVLTGLLVPICILCSWNSIQHKIKEFMILFLILEAFIIGMFSALDIVVFYIFFEAVLIPMFLIIGIWGSVERIYASFKFFLYTLLGSVLMLIAIIYIIVATGTSDLLKILEHEFTREEQLWLFLGFFFSFAVKVPMWPFHTWLPDAHVQAPTAGSIILAGILLKMGGYGFLRFSLPLFPEGSIFYQPLIFFLSCVAIIYTSLVAFAQQDIKKLIAYSSVAHMGFVTIGIFCFNTQGLDGAVFQMISHGLISGALFLAIGVIYERTHTRDINMLGDFATTMPKYSVFLMVFTLGSVGLPGTSGFIGEVLVLLGSWKVNPLVAMISGFSLILGAIYMLRFYKKVSFGVSENKEKYEIFDTNIREILTFIPLAILILLLGFFPNIVLNFLKVPHFLILESFK
ncbi:MAG: NADH-quinone oxidoreductase subunit M [SAR116 cluster bacterium]|nr:NADH-quinone oxidoreductase subunit M [SAR116 cluster bacterium]RPH08484.1 MAG: NADH-quinone oxidoreductase subunit M [Alphaproteobacteria bacterium TMED54]